MKTLISIPRFLVGIALSGVLTALGAAEPGPRLQVDFNKDIRPILSEACFQCHGPDENERKGGLRLDLREAALKPAESGAVAIVPGAIDQSTLIERVLAKDGADLMPPPKSGKKLTVDQKAKLREWIAAGAPYATHWSYVKPSRPALPKVRAKAWPQNPIDYFILARLEKEGLSPSPKADRTTLVRRVFLDLTGLPPSPSEVKRFLADESAHAYDKMVDRALANESFGEHWARNWLDLARYADSAGYADDQPRTIWAYRDYVIRALNANKPFDQFTVEQLAGDLLPQPTEEELIATAFHRNTMTNNEGGTIDEEFRNAAIVDRVNTTMSVWMGTSMACAQCHTHKYDPITQKEYFQFYAFLNNTADADRAVETPVLEFFTSEQRLIRQKHEAGLLEAEAELNAVNPSLLTGEVEWVKAQSAPGVTNQPPAIQAVLKVSPEKRTADQKFALTEFYFSQVAPESRELWARWLAHKRTLVGTMASTVPIMRELPKAEWREARIQRRGNYQDLGEPVTAAVPAAFPPLPEGVERNRLTLARWLTSGENPLTSRVLVNRFWEQLFGVGIVRTTEEFGSQGDLPEHPELLDWMASEIARNWDVKSLLKIMVTSATYQQSSKVTPLLEERDRMNLLLARGPRVRMSGEMVRDQALAISGLLNTKMFGPSVRPIRPALGLAAAFGSSLDWKTSEGPDRYRRGLYIEWRRTSPYPSLVAFDAPTREVCTLRRERSNTPLQALVTLNDPVFVEAAQALARQVMGPSLAPTAIASEAFQRSLIRPPTREELKSLVGLYEHSLAVFSADLGRATRMATEPLGPVRGGQDVTQLAAWTVVCNVILNLDETVMRP